MRALALALVLGLCACDEGPPPNRILQLDGGGLSYFVQLHDFDGTDQFTWDVSTNQALVRFDGTALDHGSVQVTFVGPDGARLLSAVASPDSTPQIQFSSQEPQLGPWNVRVDFTQASGVLAFTAVPSQ